MIDWSLPGPLPPFDGIEQPLPTDGKDISLVAVAMFAAYGVALASDQLEEQLRKPRRSKRARAPENKTDGLTRFYKCLNECLSTNGFKLTGVPVELALQTDLLTDADHLVLSKVQSGIHKTIRERVGAGNYTHYLIGEDLTFPGHDILVDDTYFDDETYVSNDTRPTPARAWRSVQLGWDSAQIVLDRFRSGGPSAILARAPASPPLNVGRRSPYKAADAKLHIEMEKLLEGEDAVSAEDAARIVAPRAIGRGTIDSKIERLAKGFRRVHPEWVQNRKSPQGSEQIG